MASLPARRSFDAHINLVPYIDLMTTIITFLMMTAVWMQVSALEIQTEGIGAEVVEEKIRLIAIKLTDHGFAVSKEGLKWVEIPKIGDGYDLNELGKQLRLLKADPSERIEIQLKVADGIKYDTIVHVIDLATGLGLSGITLKPNSIS